MKQKEMEKLSKYLEDNGVLFTIDIELIPKNTIVKNFIIPNITDLKLFSAAILYMLNIRKNLAIIMKNVDMTIFDIRYFDEEYSTLAFHNNLYLREVCEFFYNSKMIDFNKSFCRDLFYALLKQKYEETAVFFIDKTTKECLNLKIKGIRKICASFLVKALYANQSRIGTEPSEWLLKNLENEFCDDDLYTLLEIRNYKKIYKAEGYDKLAKCLEELLTSILILTLLSPGKGYSCSKFDFKWTRGSKVLELAIELDDYTAYWDIWLEDIKEDEEKETYERFFRRLRDIEFKLLELFGHGSIFGTMYKFL